MTVPAGPSLVIDIGNTRVKAGLYVEGRLTEKWEGDIELLEKLAEVATNQMVRNAIFSSVAVPAKTGILRKMEDQAVLLELNADTPLPYENTYRTPQTLGKDRVAAVAGGMAHFPGSHVLIIDAGTCVTFDLLEAGRIYRGGTISPGLQMRYRAMHEYTARLPQVGLPEALEKHWWGLTTEEALQKGGLQGLTFEIEGYVDRCEQQLGDIVVVITGGDADILADQMKRQIFVRRELVLDGLHKILLDHVERMGEV